MEYDSGRELDVLRFRGEPEAAICAYSAPMRRGAAAAASAAGLPSACCGRCQSLNVSDAALRLRVMRLSYARMALVRRSSLASATSTLRPSLAR